MRRFSFRPALLVILGAAAFLGAYGSGLSSARADQPYGNLSLDASPGDNAYNAVGTIASTASVTDTCGNGGGITVEMVIGNSGTQDGVDESGGIPAGNDIGGWQARIQFNPGVLTFVGFQVSDSASGAQLFMEKASTTTTDHIAVVFPSPAPGIGTFDIGSTVLATPAGANGVGMIARLTFDCVAAGGTVISIGDSVNSFFTDIAATNHLWAARNSACLLVNGGTAPDTDGDGWTDCPEVFITTDPLVACTPAGWPPDPNSNGVVGIDDVFFGASRFGQSTGGPSYNPRAEIASQNGTIAIDDIFGFASRFGQSC